VLYRFSAESVEAARTEAARFLKSNLAISIFVDHTTEQFAAA
jgi:hypothetical protein